MPNVIGEGACIVIIDQGRRCAQPATIFDQQRGGLVCLEHAPPRCHIIRPDQVMCGELATINLGKRFGYETVCPFHAPAGWDEEYVSAGWSARDRLVVALSVLLLGVG